MEHLAKVLEQHENADAILAERLQKAVANVIKDEDTYFEWRKETRDMYNYAENVVGNVGNSKRVRITVTAKNDAYIGLGEDTSHSSKKYEVIIGGTENSTSTIRYNN